MTKKTCRKYINVEIDIEGISDELYFEAVERSNIFKNELLEYLEKKRKE